MQPASLIPLQHILQNKIVAIVRGIAPNDVIKIAFALYAGGVNTMEVTLNSDNALSVIKELCQAMQGKMLIGAGTVIGKEMVHQSIDAGARFIISPIVDEETIKAAKERGAVSIPGAFSPTEIYRAFMLGADIIKVFPASGNVNYIKEVRAPLPHIPLMPTGGINLQNIKEFKKAGAVSFGISGALVDVKQAVTDEYLKRITENARQFIRLINEE